MLSLHVSNRHELLQSALLARLGPGRGSPFEPDELIVPSAAHRRALTLALADAHGVAANLRFGYLADWLWQQVARVVPGVPAVSPFEADRLGWRLLAAFDDAAFVAPHPRLSAYLERADAVMRWELAMRVARLFEQYVTYRPEWLDGWQHGRMARELAPHAGDGDERWQAALWARVVTELDLHDRDPVRSFIDALAGADAQAVARWGLPTTAQVMAPPSMPPVHLALLHALSRWVEIDLYLPNPCREYWTELVDPRRLAHLQARGRDAGHEVGHRLLAGWGKQTQALLDGVWSLPPSDTVDESTVFVEPETDTLLGRLQASILDVVEPEPHSAADLAATPPGPRDPVNIEVHECHSTTRELEVLHDRLLAHFAADPGLRASDVLVVTPDLEAAAPLIDAVFGTAPAPRRLPYVITGRAQGIVAAPARALLALLDLVDSRWPVSQVFGLLQLPVVARRFDLDDTALQQVHDWLLEAGVHWGRDADHRASLELPAQSRHTLDDGLDRLFFGHALPEHVAASVGATTDVAAESMLLADRLPSGDAEGSGASALGSLWRYTERLGALRDRCARPHAPAAWGELLGEACRQFLAPQGDELDELQALLEALQTLVDDMGVNVAVDTEASHDAPALPLAVMRAALRERLDDAGRGGVPTGRISFASMSALRGLPFRWVCAFGLNDGAWPSRDRPAEFDLMARAPRRTDRQRRLDERNVFLDLVLAARDGLHLSYVGRSVRDNAVLPPSVLVSELVELLVPALAARADTPKQRQAARQAAHARLVVEHPLQGFSAEAFRPDADPRRRSHHETYAQALQAQQQAWTRMAGLQASGTTPTTPTSDAPTHDIADDETLDDDRVLDDPRQQPVFLEGRLPPVAPDWHELPIERLMECLRHPGRFLLRRRLGLDMGWAEPELSDDEAFTPERAVRKAFGQRLMPALLGLGTAEPADLVAWRQQAHRLARAGVDWPGGQGGRLELERLLDSLLPFALRLREALAVPPLPPQHGTLSFELPPEDDAAPGSPPAVWRLSGGFGDLRPVGLLRWSLQEPGAADMLQMWAQHLLLTVMAPAGVEPVTRWLHPEGELRFAPPEDARAILQRLVAVYRRATREAIPLYPRSAFACALQLGETLAARRIWTPTPHGFAEGADEAWQLVRRGRDDDPLGPAFVELALSVFSPLINHADGLPGTGAKA